MDAFKIGYRIKQRREELGLTQEHLATALGLNKSSVQRYESGQVKKIKLPILESIAQCLNVNPDWLVCKTDAQTEYETQSPAIDGIDLFQYANIYPIATQRLPMLGEIACGQPIFANEDRESYVVVGIDIKADFVLRAKGDSMINARIHDGDIVFIKKQSSVENGEIAAVVINDEATLKRVYYSPEQNQLTLTAENPTHTPFVYRDEELEHIHILGKAVAFQSDVK